MMSDADIARLADALAARVLGRLSTPAPEPATGDILTRAEARRYVKRTSDAAFSRWCRKWRVKARAHGRHSRCQLDLALAREAGSVHLPADLRRHQKFQPATR